jgi:hypothetical protein
MQSQYSCVKRLHRVLPERSFDELVPRVFAKKTVSVMRSPIDSINLDWVVKLKLNLFRVLSRKPSNGSPRTARSTTRPGWPDLANFSHIGWLFTLGIFLKITIVAKILWYFSHDKSYILNIDQKYVVLHAGQFFHKLIWSPFTRPSISLLFLIDRYVGLSEKKYFSFQFTNNAYKVDFSQCSEGSFLKLP